MMKIRILTRNVYQLIVVALMYSVSPFNLLKSIKYRKLLLVYKKGRKELNLEDYKPYVGDREDESIPESEKESSINTANS